jgi:hypothetical protein
VPDCMDSDRRRVRELLSKMTILITANAITVTAVFTAAANLTGTTPHVTTTALAAASPRD